MECIEAILTRRSVRAYTAEPIPEELLRGILDAAFAAPSALNYQPWYLAVIRSGHARGKLLDIMAAVSNGIEPELQERFPTHPEVVRDTCGFVRSLGGAPACVLVFQDKPQYPHPQSGIDQSIAAAIENMMLAAWGWGIGSCWMTAPVNAGFGPALQQAFAPDKGPLLAIVTLGYPARVPGAPRRKEGRFAIL